MNASHYTKDHPEGKECLTIATHHIPHHHGCMYELPVPVVQCEPSCETVEMCVKQLWHLNICDKIYNPAKCDTVFECEKILF